MAAKPGLVPTPVNRAVVVLWEKDVLGSNVDRTDCPTKTEDGETRPPPPPTRRTAAKGVQDYSVVRWETVRRNAVGSVERKKRRVRGQALAGRVRWRVWGTVWLFSRRRLQGG